MTIRIVTTCHKAGFDDYGHRMLEGWHLMPANCELHWYTEGYEIPPTERVTAIDNSTLTDLQAFKQKYSYYLSPDFRMDVVRFSHKVFAFIDALADHDGLGVWMDADVIPHAQMPEGFIESLLPAGKYIALYKRPGFHSECGFWVVDCTHPGHKAFLTAMKEFYTADAFKQCREWHDSYLMDIAIRNLEKEGVISSHSLSGAYETHHHPMAVTEIAQYVDHIKGPDRKRTGYSSENAVSKAMHVR